MEKHQEGYLELLKDKYVINNIYQRVTYKRVKGIVDIGIAVEVKKFRYWESICSIHSRQAKKVFT